MLILGIMALVATWFINQKKQFPITTKTHTSTQVDISTMAQIMLFGSPSTKNLAPQPIAKQTVVKSHLQLSLIGTILAGDKSAAIITIGTSHQQKIFLLHQHIQQGISLEKVEKYAVIVNNHGKLERITLKHPHLPQVSFKMSSETASKHITQSITRAYISEQTNNFSKLLSQARVLPYIQNGENHGFMISEISPHSLYQHIGLKNGDILQKVNGIAITNVAQAIQMYQTLQNKPTIDLELMRNGAMLHIHYNIQ